MSHLFAKPMVFPIIDSTNRYLADEAARGAPEGLVVVADEQSAGRGRRGRAWIADPGSALLCSMLFRPIVDLCDAHLVSTIVGLSAYRCVEELCGVVPELKWPNDLLIEGKKVAGLLGQIIGDSDAYALVVGIGINLFWPNGRPPAGDDEELSTLAERATTLERVAHRRIDRDEFLAMMLGYIEADYEQLGSSDGRRRVMERYRKACSTIGRSVRIETVSGSYEAEALRLSDSGRLVVRAGGIEHELDAVDVVHLRTMTS